MSEDDLPASDLLELQSDIINAIDKFDKFFNNKTKKDKKKSEDKGKKEQKSKGKKIEKVPNQIQVLDFEKGLRELQDLMPTVTSSKNENLLNNKQSFLQQ